MNIKTKSTEAANFSADQQLNNFLTTFKFSSNNFRFQCLNCDRLKRGNKLKPAAVYIKSENKMYVFRFCKECWESYQNFDANLKRNFHETLLKKLKRAEAKVI